MWTQATLSAEELRRQYPQGRAFLGLLAARPVAAMVLLPQDADFWPDDGPGEAL